MKVLILSGSNSRNSGGVFNTNLFLGKSLHEFCGVNIQFLLYNDEYSSEDRKLYGSLPLNDYTIQWPKKLEYSKDIIMQLSKIKPDLVHSQGLWRYFSNVNRNYNLQTGTPYIISPHGMLDPWQLSQSIWKDLKKKIALSLYEKKHLIGAKCLHALCHSEYQSIRKFGLKNPVAVIPNGTEMPAIYSKEKSSSEKSRWAENNNRKTLLFLSRIHPKKGLDNLLKAWPQTIASQQDWQLVIAGETNDKKYMQSLLQSVQKLGVENSVQFIGGQYNQNKQICLLDADAFILPSFSEGVPLAVLEAWSYRLPVIMTQFCNLPEGFESNAAVQIEPTVDSITEGINKTILMDPDGLRIIGENGFDLVNKKFTWEKVALSTFELYEWVLGKKEKPAFVFED